MDNKALEIVTQYAFEHFMKQHPNYPDVRPIYDVYIVWKCKTLQNWKWLLSTTLEDGMYYEVTYNGDKKEFYLDAYSKVENRCIPEQ